MKRASRVAIVIALVCVAARAQTGIDDIVRVLETRYAVHHHGVPALWVAKPFMIGSGVGKLKIIEFEDLRIPFQDVNSLNGELDQCLGSEWSRFVEARSNPDGEWTIIYTRPDGKRFQMLIVSSERGDGTTLVQMTLSGNAERSWFDETVPTARKTRASKSLGASGGH